GLVVACEVAGAALVFLLLARDGVPRGLALVTALSLLSMTMWFDGARVLHEPLYLLVILATAWVASSSARPLSGLASGALSAGAFRVKQYGGFGMCGLVGHALTGPKDRWRRAASILCGFVLGLGALAMLLVALGADPATLAKGLVPRAAVRYERTWI